ncbi:M7gpppx diphosphatase [Plakobranchus ocellatus]|uniref:m7GpppX diphosphatase n=1 Tax=Plakobranchus ocellatus TaxID=259542 RepID=A0AAV4A2D0_9GAST|nr:M7gpppx diphosphatase [Plakobranchus ocellatus]
MVTTCCVKGCKNRAGKNKVSFFRFPLRPESRRRAWISHVSRYDRSPKSDEKSTTGASSALGQREPSKFDRVCSEHFITGKPNNDPQHPDYFPTLKMRATRSSMTRRTLAKTAEARKTEEAQKRKEAANALLTMTKAVKLKGSLLKHKETQTSSDQGEPLTLTKAKLNHLEKEIEVLQKINFELRLQKQKYKDLLTRQMEYAANESKKRKVDEGGGAVATSGQAVKNSVFKDFSLKRVLRDDPRSKTISLHGSLTTATHKSADAVVLLERKPFDVFTIEKSLHNTRTVETLQNDIYSTHDAFSPGLTADLKATVICPATEKHISKYSEHEPFVVRETPELYRTVTEPCLAQSKFSIQWVYNILEKKTESDRIVVEDPDPHLGFVLLPDMKWDRKSVDQLYLVAIVHRHGIRSLRDLTTEHLPLLENIRAKGLAAINDKYGVPSHQMRVYLHYQPSYYHLHIHFTALRLDSPPGSDTLRAHLLDDVIDNIRCDCEFYRKKTMSYVVRDGDELYKWYKKAGYFDETSSTTIAAEDAIVAVEIVPAEKAPVVSTDLD